MRVRMIRPAYWTDADLHTRLSADQREFYIGLWMLADDEGYVAWDPARVGAELYPYRSPSWRAKRMEAWLGDLGVHVRLLDCGKHVVIPNLPKFQKPPKPSSQVRLSHDTCLRQRAPHGATGDQRAPAQGFSREGEGREGERRAPARDQDNDEPVRLGDRLLANGLDPAIGRKPA